jgi:hypothetical protein
MSLKDTIRKINTKIDILQKSLEEDKFSKKLELNPEDLKIPQIDTTKIKNKLEDYRAQLRNKKLKKQNKESVNNNGIFGEVVRMFDKILAAGRKVNENEKYPESSRLRKHALDSAEATQNASKQIIMDSVKKVLFAGDGICGGNDKFFGIDFDSVNIKPQEIDFLHMLRVDPNSDYGKIMFESPTIKNNKKKVNRSLYDLFTSGSTYDYTTPSERTIFRMSWDSSNQEYNIQGLTMGTGSTSNVQSLTGISVNEFIDDYYSNMEFPDINDVIKKSMLLTLKAASVKADGSGISAGTSFTGMDDPLSFTPKLDESINNLERMLNKLFAFCNNRNKSLSGQTTIDLLSETEEDDEFYFNFDDVEGIDLEDEDARKRKVLRFKDCNNYEVPYNASIMEDFVYLEDKINKNEWIRKTLDKAAIDAYEQSEGSLELPDFQISLNLGFIFNIPKAVVMSSLSPKVFLPIMIIYRLFVPDVEIDTNYEAKDLMRDLKKLFKEIITQLFWKFLRELWQRLKVDLKNFLLNIVRKIIADKLKRYYIVVAALIALLKKIIESGIDNCDGLFGAINAAIEAALSATGNIKMPNVLLLLADKLPGFSAVKTNMEAAEKMSALGIPTGDVNGEPNYLLLALGANTNALADNIAKTPFEFVNKTMPVAGPFPGAVPAMAMRGAALMKTS